MYGIPVLLDSKQYFFISHMNSPSDFLYPSPAPLKTIILIIKSLPPKKEIVRTCGTFVREDRYAQVSDGKS
jgi:hypothetical protein